MLTVKYLKQCKVFKFFFVRNSSLQEMANFNNNIIINLIQDTKLKMHLNVLYRC